ncbi:MAG: polysaccharide biosynthesis protein [Tepidisphaera sp.]
MQSQSISKPNTTSKAVLIGTSSTLPLLSEQLALLPNAPTCVGHVLTEGSTDAAFDTLESLPRLVASVKPDLAIVSLPQDASALARRVQTLLASLGLPQRDVPPLSELIARPAAAAPAASLATTNWADLIGRRPHAIDRRAVAETITGKRVLITGAGGSIGSELARIVASFEPSLIVLMERSENALFEIDRELAERFPKVHRKAVLHDVTDADATLRHFTNIRPNTVFHAAAHKHVPLMEDHPSHAVTNNLFGTKSVADASLATGVTRFVLISSDKAVNPSSVMGATKRLAEIYVQALHRQGRAVSPTATRFAAVRFGNVLGSACSVLPIWASQIERGGPVTVTDERMTRYFMTINEAATLVVQAAALTGDVPAAPLYVLDMGEPLRIFDLAHRFVRSRGYTPVTADDEDPASMRITLTGTRPGEKLHEELAYDRERLAPTAHPGIRAWLGDAGERANLPALVADLSLVRSETSRETVVEVIRRYVPEMKSGAATEPKLVVDPTAQTKTDRPGAIAA